MIMNRSDIQIGINHRVKIPVVVICFIKHLTPHLKITELIQV
ncbi:unnamed protein product [Schistosoma curassoni]|uniref:Transposase n=1 Tax=Schistosoma curassoni TaxID=6186 RepID=A0A183L619_9TREM|nr:unnamed protein product [Schistosoma curassoni]